jgi:hypothetical protein
MSAHPTFHDCERCGGRVGVYEPSRIELADGTVLASSLLALGVERAREVVKVWHRACQGAELDEPAR